MPQVIAGFLERTVKFVHALGIGGNSSRVYVSDDFQAQIGGAANPLGSQE